MVSLYLMTVAGFHFPSHIPPSQIPSSRLARAHTAQYNTWLKPSESKSGWTTQIQHSSSATCGLPEKTQPVSFHTPTPSARSPPTLSPCHTGPALALAIWATTWACWISITLSSAAAAQISPWPRQQVWVFPLDPLPVCWTADPQCHKGCTQPSTRVCPAHLHYGQESPAATSQLTSQHLNYSAFQRTGEGKMKENSRSKSGKKGGTKKI